MPLTGVPEIAVQELDDPMFRERQVRWLIARFDQTDPVVSGNKKFKLHFFLEEARASGKTRVVTFGGAFSNHLVATAKACHDLGFRSLGIVRGTGFTHESHTLKACRLYGMELLFVERDAYASMASNLGTAGLKLDADNDYLVPEGGFHPLGAAGAALMLDGIPVQNATHIVCATGTGATVAGLLRAAKPGQEVVSVPVLKNLHDLPERMATLLPGLHKMPMVFDQYHFGGYAKYNALLLDFMNTLYHNTGIPTDFVYTAKMMYAIKDQVKRGYFAEGSVILAIHTGGLQGNLSLPAGTLVF